MKAKPLYLQGRTLTPQSPGLWRIEPTGNMRVGVVLVGTEALLARLAKGDRSLEQACNVATLPGVLDPVLTMADLHQGYGFPIGGVAAFHAKTGVVSPGGVGYDINCGVRLLRTPFERRQVEEALPALIDRLFETVPSGVGSRRNDLSLGAGGLDDILAEGAHWAVQRGFGAKADLEAIEEGGRLRGAEPGEVSARARERGENQIGTLGSGNHFIEVQAVDRILDAAVAEAFGLFEKQIVVMIHTGSRGLGYQVCADALESTLDSAAKYGISLVDKELAAAPIESSEGKSYLGAMQAAANFAFANRQVITHWVREAFRKEIGSDPIELVYDVCHNIAKFEEFPGWPRVCVHRKGATRAYPAGHPSLPARYRKVGQPILVPGDMGRYSYVLVGKAEAMERSFGSACHGAGRELSRAQAKKVGKGRDLERELREQGVRLRVAGRHTALEEMPEAYKDVAEVVAATAAAGLAGIVARLRPLGVIKG